MIPANPDGFTLIEEIGKGAFSTVWKALHNESLNTVAIKVTQNYKIFQESDLNRYENETKIHSKVSHPFICPVLGQRANLINNYLVLEYIPNGSLLDKIDSKEGVSEEDTKHYFAQMVLAIEYLHSLKICHHDIKPQNILIDADNNIRLIDFGLCTKFTDEGITNGKGGSPRYAAPELFKGKTHNEKVDIWSLGVILYRMVVGYYPFINSEMDKLIRSIVNERINIPSELDKDLRDLLSGMLEKNPEKRFSVQDIKNNKWFKDIYEKDPTLTRQNFAGTNTNVKEMMLSINVVRRQPPKTLSGLRLERTKTLEKLVASGDFKLSPKKREHRNSIPIMK